MSKLILPSPTTADGQPLTDEAQDELMNAEVPLHFSHIKRDNDGKPEVDSDDKPIVLARHAMIVDPSRITTADLVAFQTRNNKIQDEAEALDEEIATLTGTASTNRAGRRAAKKSEAEVNEVVRAAITQAMASSYKLAIDLKVAKAELLARLVSEWTLRRGGVMIEPTAAFLQERTGPGRDAFDALDEWYFPTSNGAEEETGTTENPSTPAP